MTAPAPADDRETGFVETADVSTDPLSGRRFDSSTASYNIDGGAGGSVYAGADFLFLRPHFSEGVAFVRGLQTPATYTTSGTELHFDYEPGVRLVAGYQFAERDSAIQFSTWHFEGGTDSRGTVPGPGSFIVDPFGNIVGTAVVIDPADARFGLPIVGGDLIRAGASVDISVYDLDYRRRIFIDGTRCSLDWLIGLRVADVDQDYGSLITAGGVLFSRGTFLASFLGAGPTVGAGLRARLGTQGQFSTYARSQMSLLLGEYDVQSVNSVTVPAPFTARQQQSLTRTIPVLETELGAAWQATEFLELAAGWQFQAWSDMGASGGTFGGFFAGADDGNLMSFDGLFLRAEFTR